VRGTEEEGSRISKELHDNIGSRLALLKNQIDYMEFDKAKIKAQVNDIFMDVRLISDELSPNKIALLGIIPSIKELFNQLVNSTDIKVNFYAQEKVEISVENAIHIYRVFQEIIQNILKHSQATTVDCQVLKEDNGAIVFVVDDNGVGYDSASHNYQFSSGLQNIRFRIEAINGKIDISSKPNAGTHIMIWCG
jgi:signal transduction histidine kinase